MFEISPYYLLKAFFEDVEAQIDEQKAIIFLSKNELEKVNFEYNQKLINELSGLNKEKAELKKTHSH